jgi:hypothetical protein
MKPKRPSKGSGLAAKLNQELKALREGHCFANDEISRARQKNENGKKKKATGTRCRNFA